jgi:CheY-like chemotaxis protein
MQQDVSSATPAEDPLGQARQKISSLETALSQGTAHTHELNNVLTPLLGNLTLVQLDLDPDTDLARNLKDIERACLRMRDIIALMAEAAPRTRTLVNVEQSIRQAVQAAAREVRCGIRVDAELWPVSADEPQLAQVLRTLLANARAATPAGSYIEIDAWNTRATEPLQPGRYVAIRVTDHGSAIPRETLDQLFHTENPQRPGLPIAHAIIEDHAGSLRVESREGAGAIFTIFLLAATPAVTRPKPKPAAAPRINARILVMDDEQPIRELTGRMLASVGFTVETACEGEEAIRKYRAALDDGARFDVILLDLRVPMGMGGFDAFQAIREFDPTVKAIISSGQAEHSIVSSFRAHGIAALVPKPYKIDDLLDTVRKIILSPAPQPAAAAPVS